MIDITEAKVLVSGGRGVGTAEGFQTLRELATCSAPKYRLRVRWSMPAFSHTSARSDKPVNGASGSLLRHGYLGCDPHLAGMEESDFIIAVNKDKFAPIFNVATWVSYATYTRSFRS